MLDASPLGLNSVEKAVPQFFNWTKPTDTVLSKDVKILELSNHTASLALHSAPKKWAGIYWGLCVA